MDSETSQLEFLGNQLEELVDEREKVNEKQVVLRVELDRLDTQEDKLDRLIELVYGRIDTISKS